MSNQQLKYGEIYSVVLVNKLNNLIDEMLNVCNNMSDIAPTCIIYLNEFKQKINGHLEEHLDENEIDTAVHQLRKFISSIKLDEKQRIEVEEIINFIRAAAHKLLVNFIIMSLSFLLFSACRMI